MKKNSKIYKKTSIRLMILIPVVILGLVCVISNVLALLNIKTVNKTATVISDDYLTGIQCLSDVQSQAQQIHNVALSHIIATDFNTMIDLSEKVESVEVSLEDSLTGYANYVAADDENYKQLKENYLSLKMSVRQLLAYSAAQNTVEAYACANGEVEEASSAMDANINALKEEIDAGASDARAKLAADYKMAMVVDVILVAISIVSVIAAVYVVLVFVIRPLIRAKNEIQGIIKDIDNGEGDLTKRISITSDNEIAALGKGINAFMEKLQDIFILITNNSGQMEQVVSEVLGSVRTSNESASDLSAVTEELSATMQEVANSAGVINTNTNSVNNEVYNIAEKSNELNEYSKSMKQHADHMEQAARDNMEQTNAKVNEILEILNQAIEDAKSVDQVNSLTNDILNISSQTNLLALNASIEAARAGEAGKGFAVVASEISQLADSSRDAANHIQQINQIVTDAVHNLSGHAQSLVEFMQVTILPEFEEFVNEGEQYKQNATYIENSMESFNEKTDSLQAVMNEITSSINSITSAIEEGVKGVSGAAESTQALVFDMDNITERMGENEKIAGNLQQETAVFKKL